MNNNQQHPAPANSLPNVMEPQPQQPSILHSDHLSYHPEISAWFNIITGFICHYRRSHIKIQPTIYRDAAGRLGRIYQN